MTDSDAIKFLSQKAMEARRDIVRMIYYGGSGHPGGALSCTDILITLYHNIMDIDPGKPEKHDRDRFVLSKAHAAPAVYAVLAGRGFFDRSILNTFSHDGSMLQKHIDMHLVPGIDISGGSLGQGLSVAVGMALVSRMDKLGNRIYTVIGDGESQEGQIWEAAMAAAHYGLGNITVFLDRNMLQVDGTTEEIMSIEPVISKWKSFGWNTANIDGHDYNAIIKSVKELQRCEGIPGIIVADTIKGKGVSFVENRVEWHARTFTKDECRKALTELGGKEDIL